MYSISRFQQIIKPVMNGHFARHVRTHKADKHSKGFGCQNLLLCLLYAQLGRCASLRTLEQSFNAHSSHHYHLNMRSIRRSTLSEALAKRDTRPNRCHGKILRRITVSCPGKEPLVLGCVGN